MWVSIAFKVVRGCAYRAVWILLYIGHLALALIAAVMFLGVVLMAVDEGGGRSGPARRDVTVGERCGVGLTLGSLGIVFGAAALKLRRRHRQINPLYPEMQFGLHTARAMSGQRLLDDHPPPSTSAMYDRELDGGL